MSSTLNLTPDLNLALTIEVAHFLLDDPRSIMKLNLWQEPRIRVSDNWEGRIPGATLISGT